MQRNTKLILFVLLILLFLSGCDGNNSENLPISPMENSEISEETKNKLKEIEPNYNEQTEDDSLNLTVPHLNYCKGLGYNIDVEDNCIFENGESCQAWEFLKGKCYKELSFCQKNGYKLETKSDKIESGVFEYAICVFDDKTECEEYQYFIGKCSPGQCKKYELSKGGCIQ